MGSGNWTLNQLGGAVVRIKLAFGGFKKLISVCLKKEGGLCFSWPSHSPLFLPSLFSLAFSGLFSNFASLFLGYVIVSLALSASS